MWLILEEDLGLEDAIDKKIIIKIEWYVQVVNEFCSQAIKSYSERRTLKERYLLLELSCTPTQLKIVCK